MFHFSFVVLIPIGNSSCPTHFYLTLSIMLQLKLIKPLYFSKTAFIRVPPSIIHQQEIILKVFIFNNITISFKFYDSFVVFRVSTKLPTLVYNFLCIPIQVLFQNQILAPFQLVNCVVKMA